MDKATNDGTGFTGTGTLNEFDFTRGQLPTGVEAVGEGVELCPGRGGDTYLHVRKGTFLRLPLRGLRHEKLRPEDPIQSYSLTLEIQLGDNHPRLEHPWSLFQASFPEVHDTDEVTFMSQLRAEFPKWKVGTDVDKLVVNRDIETDSQVLAELPTGTVVQQIGEAKRLPNGGRRALVKFKRTTLAEDLEKLGKDRCDADKGKKKGKGFRPCGIVQGRR